VSVDVDKLPAAGMIAAKCAGRGRRVGGRVVQNLLENAVLYAGEDSPVTIGARDWNEGVRIWVEDRGPGIALEEREAVFEKFYRGHSTSGHAPSGTGLGLAITREIVRSHGGTVRVEDVAPHGARFVIALPSGRSTAAPTHVEEMS
jgi:signal transduction histidine kinase